MCIPSACLKPTIALLILGVIVVSLIILSACTISNTCVHTQGKASDVIDETQDVKPTTQVSATIPLR